MASSHCSQRFDEDEQGSSSGAFSAFLIVNGRQTLAPLAPLQKPAEVRVCAVCDGSLDRRCHLTGLLSRHQCLKQIAFRLTSRPSVANAINPWIQPNSQPSPKLGEGFEKNLGNLRCGFANLMLGLIWRTQTESCSWSLNTTRRISLTHCAKRIQI